MLYLKELIVILGLSIPLFAAAKSTALVFMDEGDFKRRRNIWLVLTIAAFLSPNFWLFVVIAAPTLYWGGKQDTNPIAFYLLLLNVIPTIEVPIPSVFVKQLFDLDVHRLLSLCVLLPAALQIRRMKTTEPTVRVKSMELALLGLAALQIFLFVPPDPTQSNNVILHNSATNDLRDAFLFLVDIYLLYYVASRSANDRRKLLDAMAAFCLSCCLMAFIALFESVRHWLLYTDLTLRWGGDAMLTEYFIRGPLLRAEASSGQPLALGFLLVIALGFWLYLRSHLKGGGARVAVTGLLCAGLLVSFSRGPWLAAVVAYLAYAAFGPRGASRLVKAGVVLLLLGGLLLASPMGNKITAMIPFTGGQVGESSLTYRELLLQRSWELIKARPVFGDQLALSKMQDLRQGQGIIDVINGYVDITLFYGFTGLAFFLAFILSGLSRTYRLGRQLAKVDLDTGLAGANLAACIVAILVLLADGSIGGGPECILYVLIGLAGAYAGIASSQGFSATGSKTVTTTAAAAALRPQAG